MPFVSNEDGRRKKLEDGTLEPESVGDLCFLQYLPMIRAWHKERRWTTAHNIFKETFDVTDRQAAKSLAFLVFFVKEVMPYEDEKEFDNGDIF